MAIVVEEEKKSSNTFAFFGWIIVAAIIVAAIYYIFFVTPVPAVIAPSGAAGTIGSIPSINVNPQDIVGGAEFQQLQPYIAEPTATGPVSVGRQNPFVAP